MRLYELLEIPRGVTAVVGSGGKTTLIRHLAEELRQQGSVLICTTTKMWLPEPGACYYPTLRQAAEACRPGQVVYTGPAGPQGKLLPPEEPGWQSLADYVLVEADGAAGRPLKAHRPWEPMIPPETDRRVLVVGAAGLGRPLAEAAHCPELFARLTGCGPEDPATPERIARVVAQEALGDVILLNQADAAETEPLHRLAQLLGGCAVSSLEEMWWQRF